MKKFVTKWKQPSLIFESEVIKWLICRISKNTYYTYCKKQKRAGVVAEESDFMSIGSDVKKIYIGTEKDHILIWERGMSVPAASEEMETRYKAKILDMQE